MDIKIVDGNLLDSKTDLIIHQVNCQGKMNSGVAKAIREKWPVVFEEYQKFVDTNKNLGLDMLGVCQPVTVSDTQKVINMFSQDKYGYDGSLYTSYDAVNTCLRKTKNYMIAKGCSSISLPYNMCCCRGGANWTIIMELIKDNFNDTDFTIEIYKLQ